MESPQDRRRRQLEAEIARVREVEADVPGIPRITPPAAKVLITFLVVVLIAFLAGIVLAIAGSVLRIDTLTVIGAGGIFTGLVVALVVMIPLRRLRTKRLPFIARRLGLEYSARDPFGMTVRSFPFSVLIRNAGESAPSFLNVMWGTYGGWAVRVFDYLPGGTPNLAALTCGVAEARFGGSPMRILRVARSADDDDLRVQTEWGEFNREFRVLSRDRRWALAVLDARLMVWLLDHAPRDISFELQPGAVLCWRSAPGIGNEQVEVLLALSSFMDRIPRVVRSLYPPGEPNAPSLLGDNRPPVKVGG
jgi:hypothetical protein